MLIIAFGDVHMRPEAAERIPGIREADLVVVNGDLTNRGGRDEAGWVLDRLRALNPRVYGHIGNMDRDEVDHLFTELGINLNGRGVVIGEVGLFGVGGSPPTPFGTPSEFPDEELESMLRKAHGEVREAPVKILFSHAPPFGTAVDRLRNGTHVGSRAIRRFLEGSDCAVCVCGHIHEAVGTDRVGTARVVNPGMLPAGGYVRIDCRGKEVVVDLLRCP